MPKAIRYLSASVAPLVAALAFLPATAQAATYRNVPYRTIGNVTLHLDVYTPTTPGLHPAILMIHGGGWIAGSKALWDADAARLAQEGFVAVPVDYRLASISGDGYTMDDMVSDLRAAVAWLRANASTYWIDPTRIGALGDSAGGQLGMLLGTTGDVGERVSAVASWSGPADLSLQPAEPLVRAAIGYSYRQRPDLWDHCSPYDQVSAEDAALYMANSEHEAIPVDNVYEMQAAYSAVGLPFQSHVIPGSRHARAYERLVWDETVAFLHQYLG